MCCYLKEIYMSRKRLRFAWACALVLFATLVSLTPRVLLAQDVGETQALVAQSNLSRGYLSGDVFDGVTVRIRPENCTYGLCINNDGATYKSVVHMWNIGDSSRFLFTKADSDSYYINFYAEPSDSAANDWVLDVDQDWIKGYGKEGAAIHVVSKDSKDHQKWKLYRYSDGTYAIQNKDSGKWWTLDDTSNKDKEGNKLRQSEDRLYWEFEVLFAKSSQRFVSSKDYSSYTFDQGDGLITAMNWMSKLPGDMRITDVSMPGVHDAGTCDLRIDFDAKCQQQYIDDLLNAGTRYFDLRCSEFAIERGISSPKLNHTFDCVDKDGTNLTMDDVMRKCKDFFGGPGKNETLIFQVNRQGDDGDVTQGKVYNYLYDLVHTSAYKDYFWAGDHVPKLSEVRGKILILSRLDPASIVSETGCRNKDCIYALGYEQQDSKPSSGVSYWAIDISPWNSLGDSFKTASSFVRVKADDATRLEVFVEDNYASSADKKWSQVESCLRSAASTGSNGYWSLPITYTSASQLSSGTSPISAARNINHRLKTLGFLGEMERNFVGVVCMDFTDEQLNQRIYHLNFMRAYNYSMRSGTLSTGVTTDGVKVSTDSLTEEFCENTLTDAEKRVLYEGAHAKVWVEAKALAEGQVPQADLAAISQKASELGLTVVRYADISLWKQVGDADPVKVGLSGHQLGQKLRLRWATDQVSDAGETRQVWVLHALADGQVNVHEFQVGTDQGILDLDSLSTFALAVKAGSEPEPTPERTPDPRPEPVTEPVAYVTQPTGYRGSYTTYSSYTSDSTSSTNVAPSTSTTTSSTTATPSAFTRERLFGADRYATMSAIAERGFASAGHAVIATGENFPDALCASAVAGAYGCPLILTDPNVLSAEAAGQLTRLGVTEAHIMGGAASVSPEVEQAIASLGITCTRIEGQDRFATSIAALQAVRAAGSTADTIIVASGMGFADALSVAPLAYRQQYPIVLADASGLLRQETIDAIASDAAIAHVIIVGGQTCVSEAVRDQLGQAYDYVRLAGTDRYGTSAEVARYETQCGFGWTTPVVACGTKFADALAGAPLAGTTGQVLLLVSGSQDPAGRLLAEHAASVSRAIVLGGPASLSDEVVAGL